MLKRLAKPPCLCDPEHSRTRSETIADGRTHIPAGMDLRPELQAEDPFDLFGQWLQAASATEPNDPTAAALATASREGIPSVRMVLVKRTDPRGFGFFTNAESQKGGELTTNPHAALCFHWKSLRRQVRLAGPITALAEGEVDQYFHSRSRRSQMGAAVSQQSRPLPSRDVLERQVAEFAEAHAQGEIPRPNFWKGYLLHPQTMEFWIDGPDRLHDRLLFTCREAGWERTLLYP